MKIVVFKIVGKGDKIVNVRVRVMGDCEEIDREEVVRVGEMKKGFIDK